VRRRDVLLSLAMTGAIAVLPDCAPVEASTDSLSEAQMRAMLRLNGLDLKPDEAGAVLASFTSSRFPGAVDPTIQPTDFDPDVDV
jgi:hypothetical protein